MAVRLTGKATISLATLTEAERLMQRQAARIAELEAQLAAAQQGVPAQAVQPFGWLITKSKLPGDVEFTQDPMRENLARSFGYQTQALYTHPSTLGLDALKEARNAGINHGVCLALQIMTAAGDAGSPQWDELVDVVGRAELEHYAKVIEPEEWELAGFAQVVRFKAEIASIGANAAQAKQGGASHA